MRNKIYIGIFLISFATLALEISLIRFLSISQGYHFAFMVVSIALFGIAASGTFFAIKKINNPLFFSSIAFALSILIGFFITNKIIFDPFQAILNFEHIFVLLIYYIFLGLPFFFFGIIMAYSFSKFQKKAGKIYFYNLSGSAIGTLASLIFLSYFHTKTILIISLIGLSVSLLFINTTQNTYKKKIVFLLIAIHILLFFMPLEINISEYKELSQALNVPGSELIDTKYNSFSRVDIVESSFTRYAPGLSPAFNKTLPEQIGITIDASNMNSITKHENLDFVDYLPSSIPYFLGENKKALIINSGAGLDVLIGLRNNATVTALETNPIVIDLLKNEYANYSGNIYNKAKVFWGEGRSFIKDDKNKENFDIIIVSLSGNVLSGSTGISGLNENYLLTKEAFEGYYNSLSDDGVLVVTRWLSFPPKEGLRLFSLALEVDEEAKRTAMFRSWTTITLLISKNDLNQDTIEKIENFCEKNKFDIIYLPTDFIPNKNLKFKEPYYYNSVKNLLENKNEFYKEYIFDVSSVTDDKPFYSNFFKISKIKELYNIIGQKWNPFFDSGFLIIFVLIQAIILALTFILLPIKFFNKNKEVKKTSLVYFFAIGLSYLFIEIVFIQKFILFLGHIIFASSSVIFSVLFFSSLGALYSQKLRIKNLNKIIFILFILVISYIFLLNFIIDSFISLNLIPKMILGMVLIAPLGFFMGFPFPLGIRAIKKEFIAWAWAVNGSASVLSPILAILIALFFGYNSVLFLAAVIYLVGVFFIFPMRGLLMAQT